MARALVYATDINLLAQLRSTLRSRLLASPLCDAPLFARNLEDAFRGMWEAFDTLGAGRGSKKLTQKRVEDADSEMDLTEM